MVLGLIYLLANVIFPFIFGYAMELATPLIYLLVVLVGVAIMASAVGAHVNLNIAGPVVNGIFRGLGYVFRGLERVIVAIFRAAARVTPNMYRRVRDTLGSRIPMGVARVLAVMVVGLFWVLVI